MHLTGALFRPLTADSSAGEGGGDAVVPPRFPRQIDQDHAYGGVRVHMTHARGVTMADIASVPKGARDQGRRVDAWCLGVERIRRSRCTDDPSSRRGPVPVAHRLRHHSGARIDRSSTDAVQRSAPVRHAPSSLGERSVLPRGASRRVWRRVWRPCLVAHGGARGLPRAIMKSKDDPVMLVHIVKHWKPEYGYAQRRHDPPPCAHSRIFRRDEDRQEASVHPPRHVASSERTREPLNAPRAVVQYGYGGGWWH